MLRFRDVVAELGISVLEREELRVIVSCIGQATEGAVVSAGKCGGSEDGRVKCREDCAEEKRLAGHDGKRHLVDWRMRKKGLVMVGGGDQGRYGRLKRCQPVDL